MTGHDQILETKQQAKKRRRQKSIPLNDEQMCQLYTDILETDYHRLNALVILLTVMAVSAIKGSWIKHDLTEHIEGQPVDAYWKPMSFNLQRDSASHLRNQDGRQIVTPDLMRAATASYLKFLAVGLCTMSGPIVDHLYDAANDNKELLPLDMLRRRLRVFDIVPPTNKTLERVSVLGGLDEACCLTAPLVERGFKPSTKDLNILLPAILNLGGQLARRWP